MMRRLAIACWLLSALGQMSYAEGLEVSVTGVHLCCGGCEASLAKALDQAPELGRVTIDREQGTLRFRAPKQEQVDAALAKMLAAGFYGQAQVNGAEHEIKLPQIDDTATAARVEFVGVHLCCKGCVRDVVAAFEEANEVESVDCDLKTGRVVLTGEKIHVLDARKRLHLAGFHGHWRREESAAR